MHKKILFLFLSALLAGCGSTDDGDDGADWALLDSLFAPPTQAMRAQVLADWSARSLEAESARRVRSDTIAIVNVGQMVVDIVSHGENGRVHYGALLHVLGQDSLPTLVYAHEGDEGVDLSLLTTVLATAPELASYALVVPSFRAESLRYAGDTWNSDGEASPWDRDVDDLLQLLSALDSLKLPGRRAALLGLGFSRGGGTILLAAAREPRFTKVVDMFGPTDFFGDFVRGECEAIWKGVPSELPGVDVLGTQIVEPLRDGALALDSARLALLRRSPLYFADLLPPIQIHHGDADTTVPISESEALWAEYQNVNDHAAQSALFTYPGGGHSLMLMDGNETAISRALAYFAAGVETKVALIK
jgi:dipeptidyl aminopeptidase/acylaminoacyl peptidase